MMRTVFVIIFIFFFSSLHAAVVSLSTTQSSDLEKSSDVELLHKAISLKQKNQPGSMQLANEALVLSKKNQNRNVSAQTYFLLGELALESNHIVQSMEHFIQASNLYKSMDDERYQEVDEVIDELLPIVQQDENVLPMALSLIREGDKHYKKKRYQAAIDQFSYALKLLLASDLGSLKTRSQALKKIAQSYKRLKNKEEAKAFYKKALQVFRALDDKKNMARTLNSIAELERNLNDYVAALDYSIQALEIYKIINDGEGHAKALNEAGIIYRHIGRYEKSLQHIYEAHLFYNKINDIDGIAKTSNQMGLIYTRLKQFDQAISFYKRTIELPKEKLEPKTLASALREMAVIDLNAGNYASAKIIAKQAYHIYKEIKDKAKQSLTARIIGNAYREEFNIKQAIIYYRESLQIATEVGSKIYQIKALTPLAAMLFSVDIDESIRLLHRAVQLSEEIDSNPSRLYAYRELRKAEKIRGNYEASVGYAEKEILYTGMIQNARDATDLVMIKAKLYSHKVEMELAALRDKAKRNELEIAKKNNEIEIAEQARIITELELVKNKYASFALASLLLVCLLAVIFIYWRFINSRKRNKELDNLAARDPLTNCYNRRILFEHIDQYFECSEPLEEYCIIMADIDHFKNVNDTYGHSTGDAVICGVATILQDCVRKSDIVTRYGGEEFCIILYHIPQREALNIAENMRVEVENTRIGDVAVTCSFGVTSIAFNAASSAELINQADLALYKSKSLGRNQVTIWNPSLKNE